MTRDELPIQRFIGQDAVSGSLKKNAPLFRLARGLIFS
jgi:hypothetical protein